MQPEVRIKRILKSDTLPILMILVVFVIALSALSDKFLNAANILNVLRQTSVTAVACIGMTYVLIAGGVDISIGSIVGLVGVFTAAAMNDWGWSPMAAIFLGMFLGIACGAFNGFLIIRTGIQPIIITLATMSIFRAFPFLYTDAQPIRIQSDFYKFLGQGYVGNIPFPVVFMVLLFVVGAVMLSKSRYGTRLYAIGSNEICARLSGINVNQYRLSTYLLCGAAAGIAGMILTARIGSGVPSTGNGFEFDVLTAALIGGVSLTGGKGKLSGAMIGCMIMSVLSNGLNLLNVSSHYQTLFKGAMLLLAVILDRIAKNKAMKA